MDNEFSEETNGYVMHHGIKNQEWGVQNGPPYPLSKADHNAVVSGGDKKAPSTPKKKDPKKVKASRKRIKKMLRAKKKKAAEAEKLEKLKAKYAKDAKTLSKHAELYDAKELSDALQKLYTKREADKLADANAKERERKLKAFLGIGKDKGLTRTQKALARNPESLRRFQSRFNERDLAKAVARLNAMSNIRDLEASERSRGRKEFADKLSSVASITQSIANTTQNVSNAASNVRRLAGVRRSEGFQKWAQSAGVSDLSADQQTKLFVRDTMPQYYDALYGKNDKNNNKKYKKRN